MNLSPLDIQHMEFPTALNGYPKRQVREFLERVSSELEGVLKENQSLRDEMKRRDSRISELQGSEAELKRVVIAAERIANEIRENAKREAELTVKEAIQRRDQVLADATTRSDRLVNEAEQKRDNILSEAEMRIRESRGELLRLEREQRLFREQFRALLQAFARNLESGPLASAQRRQPAQAGSASGDAGGEPG